MLSDTDDVVTFDLGDIAQGLAFSFYRETKADGSAEYRRMIYNNDNRPPSQVEMKMIKELNELSKNHVQTLLGALGANSKGMTKQRWCYVCKQNKQECKWCVCKTVRYCGRECQAKHWKEHKKVCGK
jgi:hypothetical protein